MFLVLVVRTIWFLLEFLLLSINRVLKRRFTLFLMVCVCVDACACRCSWRPEEGVGLHGTGVAGGYELTDVSTGPSVRVLHALNY